MDLDFRGHNQHARKYIITFLFLSLTFANSIQLNFISKATSSWKMERKISYLVFPYSVNICWLCLHSIYPSFSCSTAMNFLGGHPVSHAQLLWIRRSSTSALEAQPERSECSPHFLWKAVASRESCEATMIDLRLTTWSKFLQSKWIKGSYYTDKLLKLLSRVDILWLKVSRPSKWHTWEVTWGREILLYFSFWSLFLPLKDLSNWLYRTMSEVPVFIQLFLFWPLKFRTLWLVKIFWLITSLNEERSC